MFFPSLPCLCARRPAAARRVAIMPDNQLDGTEIILVRHGRTEWNAQGRYQGSKDSPLLPEGHASAKAVGKRCATSKKPIVCVYSSPLGRAWTTAQHIAAELHMVPVSEESLTERNYGCLEGLTHDEQWAQHPEAAHKHSTRDESWAPPGGGESRLQVRKRAADGLLAIARRHPRQRVLVVTHSGLLASLMTECLGQKPNPNPRVRTLKLANTALNLLRWSGDGWQLVLWGDTGDDFVSAASQAPRAALVLAAGVAGALLGLGAATVVFSRRGRG
jgi:2,3-bisphosphoglycerate-dependent phosphoglycerate mutase